MRKRSGIGNRLQADWKAIAKPQNGSFCRCKRHGIKSKGEPFWAGLCRFHPPIIVRMAVAAIMIGLIVKAQADKWLKLPCDRERSAGCAARRGRNSFDQSASERQAVFLTLGGEYGYMGKAL